MQVLCSVPALVQRGAPMTRDCARMVYGARKALASVLAICTLATAARPTRVVVGRRALEAVLELLHRLLERGALRLAQRILRRLRHPEHIEQQLWVEAQLPQVIGDCASGALQ